VFFMCFHVDGNDICVQLNRYINDHSLVDENLIFFFFFFIFVRMCFF